MSILAQLFPEAKSLSRVDKLRLVQLLAEDLAGEEVGEIKAKQSYPVWSPDSAFNAAGKLVKLLADEKISRVGPTVATSEATSGSPTCYNRAV